MRKKQRYWYLTRKIEKKRIEKWKWKSDMLEEMTSFKYLGFTFNRKGDYADNIKDLRLRGRIAANKV